jgi:hypothetical protein
VQYTGMAKVAIGLAAASISFGGSNVKALDVYTAKLLLAYSTAFVPLFGILVNNFYENYLHELESHDKKNSVAGSQLGCTWVPASFQKVRADTDIHLFERPA